MSRRLRVAVGAALVCVLAAAQTASAHILLYFENMRVERTVEIGARDVRMTYRAVFLPEYLRAPDLLLDMNGDGTVSALERQEYFVQAANYLHMDLLIVHEGHPVVLGDPRMQQHDGGLGVTLVMRGDLQPARRAGASEVLDIIDPAFLLISDPEQHHPSRFLASKDVSVMNDEGVPVAELTEPAGASSRIRFRRDTEEAVAPLAATAEPGDAAPGAGVTVPASESRPIGDRISGLIRQTDRSAWFYVTALVLAAVFGAAHALTPGHGKAIVAAYLVGTRGRIRDAVYLGLVVTFTHTFSVILLGVLALVASQYISQSALQVWLTLASGLLVAVLGYFLLRERLAVMGYHMHGLIIHRHPVEVPLEHGWWIFRHRHEPMSALAGGGSFRMSRPAEPAAARLNLRGMTTLGVSGGIVPCPDAIVVLLMALALNQLVFGLALIAAFSVGLAAVLVAVGILMVTARPLMERLSGGAGSRVMSQWLPLGSSIVIVLLGLGLTLGALMQMGVVRFHAPWA